LGPNEAQLSLNESHFRRAFRHHLLDGHMSNTIDTRQVNIKDNELDLM